MSGTKSDDRKKPDLRDGLTGRETGGVVDADVAVNAPTSSDESLHIVKPGVSKHPAGQATQE